MREPSERLYSYYLWSCSVEYGNDTERWPANVREDPAGNFHSEASQGTEQFSQCLESSSLYECANRFTFESRKSASCGQIGFRMVVSIYYIHILKFLHFFPREQFLFIRMEDMSEQPEEILNSVSQFLNIMPYPPTQANVVLMKKHNSQKARIEPMREETRKLLHDFFAPFNRLLADLLQDDRFLWDYS